MRRYALSRAPAKSCAIFAPADMRQRLCALACSSAARRIASLSLVCLILVLPMTSNAPAARASTASGDSSSADRKMTGANPSRPWKSLQPVEARAASPLVIEQHHAVALREESRRQRPAHARVVADQIDVRPVAGNMVPQQRAVPRIVVDEHQTHRRGLEHAWHGAWPRSEVADA